MRAEFAASRPSLALGTPSRPTSESLSKATFALLAWSSLPCRPAPCATPRSFRAGTTGSSKGGLLCHLSGSLSKMSAAAALTKCSRWKPVAASHTPRLAERTSAASSPGGRPSKANQTVVAAARASTSTTAALASSSWLRAAAASAAATPAAALARTTSPSAVARLSVRPPSVPPACSRDSAAAFAAAAASLAAWARLAARAPAWRAAAAHSFARTRCSAEGGRDDLHRKTVDDGAPRKPRHCCSQSSGCTSPKPSTMPN